MDIWRSSDRKETVCAVYFWDTVYNET